MPSSARVHTPLLIGFLAAILACAPDSVARNSLAATGRWTLQSYAGSVLPAVALNRGTTTVEVTGGALELSSDGLYSIVTTYRMTQDGVVTLTSESGVGNWVDRGGQITLSRGNGVLDAAATYTADRMTLYSSTDTGAPLLIVYTR
jgi:hypothetical protein